MINESIKGTGRRVPQGNADFVSDVADQQCPPYIWGGVSATNASWRLVIEETPEIHYYHSYSNSWKQYPYE